MSGPITVRDFDDLLERVISERETPPIYFVSEDTYRDALAWSDLIDSLRRAMEAAK